MAIGEIVTGSDLKAIQQLNSRLYSERAYVAPTVFRLAGSTTQTYWPYYKSLADAIAQMKYAAGKTKTPVAHAGTISFTKEAKAQTLGINVDFYYPIPVVGITSIPYAYLRDNIAKGPALVPFRFYKTDGSGPFYSVLDNSRLGISATVISNVSEEKVAALDAYHRELQLLKTKYNTLALYLTTLSKKQLKPAQQQSFNEGSLLLQRMSTELGKIKGIDITYTSSGQIGEPITLLTILLISIIAGAVAWTVVAITAEVAKVKKLNASYDMQKWISDQQLKLAAAKKNGQITQGDYDTMIKTLEDSNNTASKAVNDVTTNKGGMLDKVQNILLLALGGYAVIQLVKK